MPRLLVRLVVAAAIWLVACAAPATGWAQADDDSQWLLPASELDGTWVVYRPPTGSTHATDTRSNGMYVIYLDSLNFNAPRYLTLSAASFDNETLADAAVYDTALNEQRRGLTITQVSGFGDGRAYRGLEQTAGRFQSSLVLRVQNVGLVVRMNTTEALSVDEANAQVDQITQQVQDWVHGVLDSSSTAAAGAR
jgi:hypothetical protein